MTPEALRHAHRVQNLRARHLEALKVIFWTPLDCCYVPGEGNQAGYGVIQYLFNKTASVCFLKAPKLLTVVGTHRLTRVTTFPSELLVVKAGVERLLKQLKLV